LDLQAQGKSTHGFDFEDSLPKGKQSTEEFARFASTAAAAQNLICSCVTRACGDNASLTSWQDALQKSR